MWIVFHIVDPTRKHHTDRPMLYLLVSSMHHLYHHCVIIEPLTYHYSELWLIVPQIQ